MEIQENSNLKSKTLSGLVWSFMERIGAQLVSFIVSLVLARLLLPEQYGIIALVTVIINICDVFVSSSFSRALVQKKDADDTDFSTVLYFNIVFSIGLYALLFFTAPFIASFFEYDQLTAVIRAMGIKLIIASVNSVQQAMVSRKMQFKKLFLSTIGGTIVSAIIGIVMALKGYGVWALVAQYLTNSFINTVVLAFVIKWCPRLVFSLEKLKVLLSYGWKVLLASLINVIYEDLRTLIIGKMYSETDLAFYNQGRKIPNLLVANINSAIQSVMFPLMANKQEDKAFIKEIVRRSMKMSAYIIMPMMLGLAACAEPLVKIVLTDNWIGCVPYLQILCINFALLPLQTANIQAIYALGRSDIALKLEIIKRGFNLVLVLISCQFGVMAIAASSVIGAVFCSIVNAFPNKKLLNYGYFEQIKDILPFVAMSIAMAGAVICISYIPINIYMQLIIQITVGIVIYIALSAIFRVESFKYVLNMLKPLMAKIFHKRNKNILTQEGLLKMPNTRNQKMDFFKGMLMLGVIFGHLVTAFKAGATTDTIWLHTFVRTYDMPLFMLLSGVFLRRTIDKYVWWKNIINKLSSILVPILIWQTLFFAVQRMVALIKGNFSISLIEYIKNVTGAVWFLWSVLICTILIILIHRITNNEIARAIITGVICIGMCFVPQDKYNVAFMLPFFAIGYFFDVVYKKMTTSQLNVIKFLSVTAFVVLLCLWNPQYNVWNSGSYLLENTTQTLFAVLFRFSIGALGCISMSILFNRLFDIQNPIIKWINKEITSCGKNTMAIYILQSFVVEYAFARVMYKLVSVVQSNIFISNIKLLGFVIAPIVAFLAMIILNRIINILKKIPRIGKIIFGFKAIDANKTKNNQEG